jgi:acetylglutamate kinase
MEALIKKAEILVEALPYIQRFNGKTIVIKYGGNAMVSEELKNCVMEDITLLKYVGINPVVVHGGGPEITEALTHFDIQSRFINGLRVTDAKTMEIAQMVLIGKTNKEIVARLNCKGGKAVGFSGIDGNILRCEKYKTIIEGEERDIGYVGKITGIDTRLLDVMSRDEYIPVIAPIGLGSDGQSYNINADTAAAAIAAALRAEKLMLLTDVAGIKYSRSSDEIIPEISRDEVYDMIERKIIDGGMIPKVLGCIEALENGVKNTHIIDGRIPHCLLLEIFTRKGIGTMIKV